MAKARPGGAGMMRNREALVLTAALTFITGALCVSALALQRTASTVPLAIAAPTLALFAALLAGDLRRPPAEPHVAAGAVARDLTRREIATGAWMLVLLALMWALGPLAGLPAYLLLYLRLRSREGWRLSLLVTTATWLVLFVGLRGLLGLHLPGGAIWNWLVRP